MNTINPSEPARATSRAIVMATANGSRDSDRQPGELVFVYGTLRSGQANHHHLAGCRFCGEARLPSLALYNLGPFPMAIPSNNPAAILQGELYAVSGAKLEELDRFEGAPRLYERQLHRLSDDRAVWVYVGRAHQVRHVPLISSGRWPG
jgi:gamma-glutamylcyclotransferase (GGCT)/AIG2-like uncharacterized protein YtfP